MKQLHRPLTIHRWRVPAPAVALALALTLTVAFSLALPASESRTTVFGRTRPEAQGVASASLLAFIEALNRLEGLHSIMLVRHGQVIAEGWWAPYAAADNHELYSLSKSFTSTAIGLAVAEGRLTIDDEVLKFFPDDVPDEPNNNLKAMRVRDLLTMSTGHQDESPTAPDKISARAFLAQPVPHKPGTHFKYNTPATFMLSAIVQKQTGLTVAEYLRPRLFEPLGIAHPEWNTNYQGISLGGYGLSVRTEDIARFGQLYLQKGKWNGAPLLSAEWVELATSRQVSNGSNPQSDWDQGYGFQFWRCRHQAFRGDGAFGQYCLVLPEQDAVLAITSGVKDMQAVLNVVWDLLLPALRPTHLRPDAVAQQKLTDRLASLRIPAAAGAPSSSLAQKISGRTYSFPTNAQNLSSLSLSFGTPSTGSGVVLSYTVNGRTSRLPCGSDTWSRGRGSIASYNDVPLAASAAWASDDTCVVKLIPTGTPFCFTWKLRFAGDELIFAEERNVGFGRTQTPQLTGRVAP
jgi:CubicO group peptidase (beta-lactamase class C family)